MFISDVQMPDIIDNIEIVNRFGKQEITHVFHDIDGTHSLIRDWPPVMSIVLHYVINTGLEDGYDCREAIANLIKKVGQKPLEESDRFCVESAGLSALTQMEWAIRRGIQEKNINIDGLEITDMIMKVNSDIIERIWNGEERFEDIEEPEILKKYLQKNTPKLFKLYEKVLNGACRDINMAAAQVDPSSWRVKGALAFIQKLKDSGTKNYFVTGAVVQYNDMGKPEGGIYEEALAVGFDIGHDCIIEALYGSTWDNKVPKDEIMRKLCRDMKIDPRKVLVVGDGRSEIQAGREMNSVTISRLPEDALRQRQIHKSLGTNIILSDYSSKNIGNLFTEE